MKKVLFVGRTRYTRPLATTHARKFAALGEVLDYRVVGTAGAGSGDLPRFTLLDGPLFYARAPFAVARELRELLPEDVAHLGKKHQALLEESRDEASDSAIAA